MTNSIKVAFLNRNFAGLPFKNWQVFIFMIVFPFVRNLLLVKPVAMFSEDFLTQYYAEIAVIVTVFVFTAILAFVKRQNPVKTIYYFLGLLWIIAKNVRHPLLIKSQIKAHGKKPIPIYVSLRDYQLFIRNDTDDFRYIEEIHFVNEKGFTIDEYHHDYGISFNQFISDLHIPLPKRTARNYRAEFGDRHAGLKAKAYIITDDRITHESNFMLQRNGKADDDTTS